MVYWIEDDVKFNTGLAFSEITDIALSQHACVSWLGYITRRGIPTWGTHLLAVHRGGVEGLQAYLDTQAVTGQEKGTSLSYLMGLDTWIKRACGDIVANGGTNARAIAKASTTSLAPQEKRHPFVGRN